MQLLLIFFIAVFFAQKSFAFADLKQNDAESELPTIIKADVVDGDKINNLLVATGHVEANKGMSTIYADKMTYNKNGGIITAIGNVRIKNIEIGNVKATEAEVKDDFSSGKFFNSKLFFNDGSYLTSPKIDRQTALVTVLKTPVFSICPNDEIVADNEMAGKKRDFFSIKSSRTTIDRGKEVIVTKHGIFRFYNVPFLYTPYLRTALPSKERQTGFLTPSYLKSSNLGVGLKTPFYWNIAPNMDLTTTPFLPFAGRQIIVGNEFRHLTSYGEYSTNLELANNEITSTNDSVVVSRTDKKYRGHLIGEGKFDFTKNIGLDFKIDTVGDRNYLRDYYFSYLNHTLSKVNLDYIKARSYHAVKMIRIQELENLSAQDSEPLIFPTVDSHIETKPIFFKEKFSLTSNATAVNRADGLQYRRVSAVPEVNLPFNLKGNLFNLNGKLEADFYSLENNFKATSPTNNYDYFQNNYKPEISLSWKLPMMKKFKSNSFLIEPMASIVSSSYRKNFNKLPNEDSNGAELTVSNLFVSDRIAGFDRNESGERLNYGVKSSLFNKKYGEFDLTIGQSYRKNDNGQDVAIKGFSHNNKSNVVGQAMYKTKKYFSLAYAFQLNQLNYRNDVNQVTAALNFDRFTFSTDYLLIRRNSQNIDEKEQINFSSSLKLTNRWKATISAAKDVVTERIIARSLILARDGCCTTFGFSMIELNPSNLQKPQTSYSFSISFKNL